MLGCRRVVAIATIIAGLAVVSGATSTSSTRLAPIGGPLRTGVTDPELFLGPQQNEAFVHVQATGATFVRIIFNWADIAPAGASMPSGFDAQNPDDPLYRWTTADNAVTAAIAHGLTPIVTVADAPIWAQQPLPAGGTRPYKPDANAYGQFALAAAKHYDGHHGLPRVTNWQAWNEPNVNVFLSPQFVGGQPFSPTEYRALLNAFSSSIHTVAASNIVVAGALSPFTVKTGGTVTIGPLRFMRQMLCMSAGAKPKPTCGARSSFDIWAIHPYTSGNAFHRALNPDDASLGDLSEVRSLLAAAISAGHVTTKRSAVRMWVTEFSWDTNPPDPHAVPITEQARWTSEALWQCWRNGIDLVTWWKLRDEPYPSSPFQSGLYFRGATIADDRPKPTLTAFRFPFVAFPRKNGVYLWGRTPDSAAHAVFIEKRDGQTWIPFARLRANAAGIFVATTARPWSTGFLRARIGNQTSLPFSSVEPPDRFIDPFG